MPDGGKPVRRQAAGAPDDDLLPVLGEMFQTVRAYLLGPGRAAGVRGTIGTNPKGEPTRAFDAEAERLALVVAAARLGSFRALSEEQGELLTLPRMNPGDAQATLAAVGHVGA